MSFHPPFSRRRSTQIYERSKVMKKIIFLSTAVAAMAAAMPAHARTPAFAPEGATPTYRPSVTPDADWHDPDDATRRQGAFVPARNIALVAPGLKKSEVYTLLDVPHFHEGFFGVRRWTYLLNFYTGNGDEYRQCEYKLLYDRKMRVESAHWREAECASLFENALAGPEPRVVEKIVTREVPVAGPVRAMKSYDFTFDFNKAQLTGMGRQTVSEAVSEVLRGNYRRIVVTGFTDTVGSQDYNDVLASKRAAATVAELVAALQSAGSPLAHEVYTRGGRDLAVQTADEVREENNRRVLIELF